jgi:hypothetical protein
MRNDIHIMETLQDLGFLYHIDEPSHDEPFIRVQGRDFVTVPYTLHMNDIVSFPFEGWNPAAYEWRCAMSSISYTRRECESAWGPDADRHANLLIHLAVEGSSLAPIHIFAKESKTHDAFRQYM